MIAGPRKTNASDTTLTDSAEVFGAGKIAAAAASPTNLEDGQVVHIDVTSVVENWRKDAANKRFYIDADGTSDSWRIFASGATDPEFRPELRIIGIAVPEPSAFGLVSILGLVMLKRSRR